MRGLLCEAHSAGLKQKHVVSPCDLIHVTLYSHSLSDSLPLRHICPARLKEAEHLIHTYDCAVNVTLVRCCKQTRVGLRKTHIE